MSTTPRENPVVWIQAASDSGCTVSMLNGIRPQIQSVLLDEILPGQHVNLRFQATIMAGQGEPVIEILASAAESEAGYLLIVEGAIPLREKCCTLGEKDGADVSVAARIADLAKRADAAIALGTCASYGGIFASRPNYPECVGVQEFFSRQGITTPVVNVPGCPPHPDWFIGTVAQVMLFGLPGPEDVDELGRLRLFYGQLIHESCPRRAHFDAGRFAQTPSEPYCLYLVGCRGPQTHADCPTRKWNGGVNWCIENNHPCIGCCEPEFPDGTSPFFEKTPDAHAPALRKDASGRLQPENTAAAFLR
jgi:hydrogenase small subunit